MKKQKLIYLFIVGFIFAITLSLYRSFFAQPFSYTKKLELKDGIDISIDKQFETGCYELGFYKADKTFYSPMYKPYTVEGKYQVELYHKEKLLSKNIIDKGTKLSHSYSTGGLGGTSSSILLYIIETPIKGHRKLTIKLKSLALEKRLEDVDSIYFYINKHKGLCGKKREALLNKRNNPIEKAESNETLKPLYKALVRKNTTKVKELLEDNLTIDTQMVGERNPIHYSAFYDDIETLHYLVSKNAKLNNKDLVGKTPLHYAIEHNSSRALEVLLDAGADFSLVGTVEDKYFPPAGVPKNRIRSAVEKKLVAFLVERNMVALMEVLLRKEYMDGKNDLYMYYINGTQGDTPYLDFILRKQGYYEDPLENRWSEINYSKMIKLLKSYGAKTYQELQQENNITKGKNIAHHSAPAV